MSVKFVLNETSYFGKNARENLVGEIIKRGFKKVFLVSDKSLVEAGVTTKVEEILKNYSQFKNILIQFKKFYGIDEYNLKDIDRYIWQLGKEYFPKNYKKKTIEN